MTGISCPSVALCVAVDWWGNVVTTTAPLAGSAGWRIARVDNLIEEYGLYPSGLTGVSCPSVRLCVLVDRSSNVITSRHPTGGAAAWKVAHVNAAIPPGSGRIHGRRVPVGVAVRGRRLARQRQQPRINRPAGRVSWRVRTVEYPAAAHFLGVSCPSVSLCVAVDWGRDVFTSRNPGATRPVWKQDDASEPGRVRSRILRVNLAVRRDYADERRRLDQPDRWRRRVEFHEDQ